MIRTKRVPKKKATNLLTHTGENKYNDKGKGIHKDKSNQSISTYMV